MNAIWQYAALSNHQAIEALKMAEYNRVRDNLKTLTASNVLASQITSASKAIALSLEAIPDQLSANNSVELFRSVHAPIYGNTIPDSGANALTIVNDESLEPETNECYQVLAIEIRNIGVLTQIEVTVTIGDVELWGGVVPATGYVSTKDFPGVFPFILSKGNPLKFAVISGVAPDMVAKVAYNKTVQN